MEIFFQLLGILILFILYCIYESKKEDDDKWWRENAP